MADFRPWQPHPGPQTEFLRDRSTECLFGGANGGGKSDCLLYKGLYPMQLPEGRTLILRSTFPTLRELMDRSQKVFGRSGATWNERDRRWTFPIGGRYEFGYGSTEAEIFKQYDGQEFDFIGVDEAGYLGSEKCIDLLRSRLRTKDARLFVQLALTANPGQPLHAALKRRFVDATGAGERLVVIEDGEGGSITRRYIRAKVTDNPTMAVTNPGYITNLRLLPEQLRRQRLDGDWDAAEGLYFSDLDPHIHLIPSVDPEPWWTQWGSFDWGFAHWAVFCWLARDDRGTTYLVDTVRVRRLHPDQIAETIWERVPVDKLGIIYGGKDCWDVHQARGVQGPTIAEVFIGKGIAMQEADNRRKPGWSLLRDLISWRGREAGQDREPRLFFMDTPGNRWLFEQMQGLVADQHDPEDVLKVNADPSTGEGGDDGADALRYGLASHESPGKKPLAPLSAFDPIALQAVYERTHRARGTAPKQEEHPIW